MVDAHNLWISKWKPEERNEPLDKVPRARRGLTAGRKGGSDRDRVIAEKGKKEEKLPGT